MKADDYFKKASSPYCSLPADSGATDSSLLTLCDEIDLTVRRIVIDFGCGQGRLLSAIMATKQAGELRNLHYIGIDKNELSLEKAREWFDSNLTIHGANGAFGTPEDLQVWCFLADYIVIVFCIHELDPINLDQTLAYLWTMLRSGGAFLVQDSDAPIHHEVEYLSLGLSELSSLFEALGASVNSHTITTGKRQIPVFILTAKKNLAPEKKSLVSYFAFRYRDISKAYLDMLHSSLLKDSYQFLLFRHAVEENKEIDCLGLAILCHRIAAKTRAYHQVLAFNEFRNNSLRVCIRCGSDNIEYQHKLSVLDSLGETRMQCKECNYRYVEPSLSYRESNDFERVSILESLNSGRYLQGDRIWRKVLPEQFRQFNESIIDVVGFLLDRIPPSKSEEGRD